MHMLQLQSRRSFAASAGFVIVVAAVVAATWADFSKAMGRETAAPAMQMQLTASGSDQFIIPVADVDPFLEQKRAAKMEELPAQF